MPAHTHNTPIENGGEEICATEGDLENGNYDDCPTDSTGGGAAHENKPPFYELVYFIKVR